MGTEVANRRAPTLFEASPAAASRCRRPSIARAPAGPWARLLAAVALATAVGCDAGTTSVGAWSPESSTGLYLEAESGELSGGFTIGNDTLASGGRYIEPPSGTASLDQPGPARARYAITIRTSATYLIWGRIHSPDAIHNRFWIQVDAGNWYVWRITTGEVWHWNAFHDDTNYSTPLTFPLSAGTHELLMANLIDGVQLDRVYVTADGDTPPGNYTVCNPPHSIQLDGGCSPSCGSQGGNACDLMTCSSLPTLPAYDCAICCIANLVDP